MSRIGSQAAKASTNGISQVQYAIPSERTPETATRLDLIPSNTLLDISPQSLTSTQLQKTKLDINKYISSLKSAQSEGYRYERAVPAKRADTARTRDEGDQENKKWTDSKMKETIDGCCLALRRLTGHLLAGEREGSEWTVEATGAIQLRMQIAKACSDFGLVRCYRALNILDS
jgi:hypothetical protein